MLSENPFTLLPLSVSIWNILKFVLLAFVLDVLVAGRLRNFWAKYNGLRAMNAKRIRLASAMGTRLGPAQEIDGNSKASRAAAFLITATILTASLLVEYGSSEGMSGSKSQCIAETLHSSKHHSRLMVDLHEMRYSHRGTNAVSLGGTVIEISDIPFAPEGGEQGTAERILATSGRFIAVCPDVDFAVINFMQWGTAEEVQVVRGKDADIILQRFISIGEEDQWVHIRQLPFVWDEICDGRNDEKEIPEVDDMFVRLLWKSLVKSAEGFSGVAALPYPEAEEGIRKTQATLRFDSESELFNGQARFVRDERELLLFLTEHIGYTAGLHVHVTLHGLQEMAEAAAHGRPEAFPSRAAVDFMLLRRSEDYAVRTTDASEVTSVIVSAQGKFAAIIEVSGPAFVCMVGNPWMACAQPFNESGVSIGIGQLHGASMLYLSMFRASTGFSNADLKSNRLRESLFNYVLLSSIKPDRELGPEAKYAVTGDAKRRGYGWGGENVVIPVQRGISEYAECTTVKSAAAVTGVFYLGMGVFAGLYAVLSVAGWGLRQHIAIDMRRTLVRTQDELVGGDEGCEDGHGEVREVGIYMADWSEGEKKLGTLPAGVKAEGARKREEVQCAGGEQRVLSRWRGARWLFAT